MSESDSRQWLGLFKALADETRLKLLGALVAEDRSVEELAALAGVKEPTVSHHLSVLRQAGLVTMQAEGNVHAYHFDGDALRRALRAFATPESIAGAAAELDLDPDAYRRKVLRDFVVQGRLKEIPAHRKKRRVILRWLAEKFEPGRRYREREVNEAIKTHHDDFATLRRELIMGGFLERERNGDAYWRAPRGDGE